MGIAEPQVAAEIPKWVWRLIFYGGIGVAVWFAYMGLLDAIMFRKDAAKPTRTRVHFIRPPKDF